ncbi:MAG: FadR/GntR family transcriptional regulator [Gemmobacter sp.]
MRDGAGSAGRGDALTARGHLLALVQDGGLGPSGRLPAERALCDRWGIGRRSLRRALDALEAEGLIWRQQGKGTFAGHPPDPTGLLAAGIVGETTPAEVMEARLCIEPVLARLAAARATPDEIARLRGIAARVMQAEDRDETELWDGALHRRIATLAGNRPLLTAFAMLDEIRANPSWRGLRERARSPGTLRISDAQHHAIIDALAAGDGGAAEAAMRDHLATLAGNLERLAPAPATDNPPPAERDHA